MKYVVVWIKVISLYINLELKNKIKLLLLHISLILSFSYKSCMNSFFSNILYLLMFFPGSNFFSFHFSILLHRWRLQSLRIGSLPKWVLRLFLSCTLAVLYVLIIQIERGYDVDFKIWMQIELADFKDWISFFKSALIQKLSMQNNKSLISIK